MAGSIKLIDTGAALVADRDITISGSGAHASATFFVDVTAITRTTGDLDIFLRWLSDDGTVVVIAAAEAIIATGIVRFILTSGEFDATRFAIPEPNQIDWDLVGDTTAVSGKVYAMYGD